MSCTCGHDASEHDPAPPDAPDAFGACAVCDDCEEYRTEVVHR